MTLSRGFLRSRPLIITPNYWIGISLGASFSFGLYALFYFLREGIRIMSTLFPLGQLLELSPAENFWHNLFYSSISVILGFYVFVKFIMEDSFHYQKKQTKIRFRHALNEQSFFFWSFLGVCGRMASILGILFLTMPLQFEINFLEDYPHLLILIAVVLYLNIWPPLQRLAGKEAYKWFLYATPSVVSLSLLFASINFIDFQEVNRVLKKNDLVLEYGLRVPKTQSHELFNVNNRCNFYSLINRKKRNESLIFIGGGQTEIKLGQVPEFLKSVRLKE